MNDPTESFRRRHQAELNGAAASRAALEKTHGTVYSTSELADAFEVKGFMAPYVIVVQKATGKRGSLEFQHMPRFYFNFVEDKRG